MVRDCGLPLSEPLLRAFVSGVLARTLTSRDLYRTRAAVFRSLRGFRRTHPALAALRGLRGQLFRSRIAKSLTPRKKTLPGRGPTVALVGADGAGRPRSPATFARVLEAGWLRGYFGIRKQART